MRLYLYYEYLRSYSFCFVLVIFTVRLDRSVCL